MEHLVLNVTCGDLESQSKICCSSSWSVTIIPSLRWNWTFKDQKGISRKKFFPTKNGFFERKWQNGTKRNETKRWKSGRWSQNFFFKKKISILPFTTLSIFTKIRHTKLSHCIFVSLIIIAQIAENNQSALIINKYYFPG